MKNVTITLNEETASWARVHAAERGMSLSRMVGEMLCREMREAREYEQSMRHFLAKKPRRLSQPGTRYPNREELYDRSRFRR